MKVQVVKVLVLFALLILTFIFGIIPVFLKKFFRKHADTERHRTLYQTVLSLLSCYAAGVFLATGILDLLPSVRVDIGTTLNNFNIFTSFPIAEFVMMFGLFVILIVEQIVLHVKERHTEETPETKPLLHNHSRRHSHIHHHHHHHRHTGQQNNPTRAYSHSISSDHSIGGISDEPFTSSFGGNTPCTGCEENLTSPNEDIGEDDANHELVPEHEHSSLRALMLMVALSLHSIFEGLAVGLQHKTEEVVSIFAALLVHKSILSFCLGMNLVQSRLSYAGVVRSILFFALTAPVGIGIGIGIMDLWSSTTSLLVQGILTGIACGTFLYVVFFEVLPSEFNCHEHRLLKVLFLLLGFATVTGVLFISDDSGPTCYVVPP